MLTARDFFGDTEWKRMKQDYDELMAYRKTLKGKPDEYDKAILDMNRIFLDFYNAVLFHTEGKSYCDCKRCESKRHEKSKIALEINTILARTISPKSIDSDTAL